MKSKSSINSFKEYIFFLSKSFFRLKQIGHFLPSSNALVKTIANTADLNQARKIVELGSGIGGTTKGLLQKMPAQASLCSIEIDTVFTNFMQENIKDQRLLIKNDSAENLKLILNSLDWEQVDVIISGIPFSTLPKKVSEEIIENIYHSLKPKGKFVAYQLRDQVSQLASPLFGEVEIQWEIKNLPPMRIFKWVK